MPNQKKKRNAGTLTVKFDYQEMRIFPVIIIILLWKKIKLKAQSDNVPSAATNNSLGTC